MYALVHPNTMYSSHEQYSTPSLNQRHPQLLQINAARVININLLEQQLRILLTHHFIKIRQRGIGTSSFGPLRIQIISEFVTRGFSRASWCARGLFFGHPQQQCSPKRFLLCGPDPLLCRCVANQKLLRVLEFVSEEFDRVGVRTSYISSRSWV